jgi:mannosyltransferase
MAASEPVVDSSFGTGDQPTSKGAACEGGQAVGLTRSTIAVALLLVSAVALALRLRLFADSLYGDELSAYFVVTGNSLGRVIHLMSGHSTELNPPLFFILAWASEKLFGSSAQSLRLISMLAGTALVPLTYLLGRRLMSVRAGLVGAVLVALSPFLMWYSSEGRPYALMVFLCLLSTLAMLKALDTRGFWWWVAYAGCSCAAMYTHYTSAFVLLAQFIWAFVSRPKARRGLLLANVAAVVGFLPWLPTLIRTERNPHVALYAGLEPFSLHAVRVDLPHWLIGHPYLSPDSIPGVGAVIIIVVGVLVAALAAALPVRRIRAAWPPRGVVLAVVLAVAAPLGIALYSSVRPSVWDTRNLLSSWPGFAVLLGGLVTWGRSPWRAIAPVLVIAGFAIGAVRTLDTAAQRPNYQAVAAFINRNGNPGAPVVNWSDLTPGPPTELEAALGLDGGLAHHPVLRLGLAPLSQVLRAAPYTTLTPPTGEQLARQAASVAGTGRMFLVLPAAQTIPELQSIRRQHIRSTSTSVLGIFGSFLGALPARFQPITVHTYLGLNAVTVVMYGG